MVIALTKKGNGMYDCDENGLNDDMQERLHRQYWEERQGRKRRIIRTLDNNESHDECHRAHLIDTLWKDYSYEYKGRKAQWKKMK